MGGGGGHFFGATKCCTAGPLTVASKILLNLLDLEPRVLDTATLAVLAAACGRTWVQTPVSTFFVAAGSDAMSFQAGVS